MVILTIHSAWLLIAGWNGTERIWCIPFPRMNSWNSPTVKAVLLSETRVSGSWCVAKSFRRALMVVAADVVEMGLTSSHL